MATSIIFILVLLIMAHGMGFLFERLRQPPVIGEILGGLILGPSLLGRIFPEWFSGLRLSAPETSAVLDFVKVLGLQLLMFVSGMEIKSLFSQAKKSTVATLTFTGALVPLLIALCFLPFIDLGGMMGPKNHSVSLILVIAVAVAVTSIPVLSRIFLDLGILNTPFARLILSIAVIEDVILYIVLAIATGLVNPSASGGSLGYSIGHHVAVNIGFVLLALGLGGQIIFILRKSLFSFLYNRNSTASLLATMLIFCLVGDLAGVPIFLSALLAGIAVSQSRQDRSEDLETVKRFGFSFFVPIYFALVGLRLNLANFDLVQFGLFFAGACLLKLVCVYAGARIEKLSHLSSLHVAVAMNARGGPGIVLATVAIEAGIISETFYTTLILTVIFSSLGAGQWLEHFQRCGTLPLKSTSLVQ